MTYEKVYQQYRHAYLHYAHYNHCGSDEQLEDAKRELDKAIKNLITYFKNKNKREHNDASFKKRVS